MGLETVLGTRRRGFFIPYRYADTVPGPGARPVYDAVARRMSEYEPAFQSLLQTMDGLATDLTAIGGAPAPAPRWRQDWFPRLDGAAAYSIVRHYRPTRIVEIGSGHSTRFMVRAVADGGLDTSVIAIDPAPRAAIADLAVDWQRTPLESVGDGLFDELQDGDVLFVDSSHILMPGTDVDRLFGHILPRLPAGVLVHIHDIFLPDDYPAAWDWRGYNEQLAVVPLVTGSDYEMVFASHYVATRMTAAVDETVAGQLELRPGAVESSLWLRKCSPPV